MHTNYYQIKNLPENSDFLRHCIIQQTDMFRQDRLEHLAFGLNIPAFQAKILLPFADGSTSVTRDSILEFFSPDIDRRNLFGAGLCLLRQALPPSCEIIADRANRPGAVVKVNPQTHQVINAALSDYRRTCDEVCSVIGKEKTGTIPTVTPDSLPDDVPTLQDMYSRVLYIHRDDPESSPLVDQNLSSSEKLLLGVYLAVLKRDRPFVINRYFAAALYPPHIHAGKNLDSNSPNTELSRLRTKLDCAPKKSNKERSQLITKIPNEIRRALGFSEVAVDTTTTYAKPVLSGTAITADAALPAPAPGTQS